VWCISIVFENDDKGLVKGYVTKRDTTYIYKLAMLCYVLDYKKTEIIYAIRGLI
jgi:hypothetical protein